MGDTTSCNNSTDTPNPNKRDEQQVLANATKVTRQLNLYENETQLRQQRHLIARILLYGHSHLITHLRTFQKSQQIAHVTNLRSIDFETIDLLYENLVLHRLKGEKVKMVYSKIDMKDKKKEKPQVYQHVRNNGKLILSQQKKKVAILIFAGGSSSRFKDKTGNSVPKELYSEGKDEKCLLERMLDKVGNMCEEYGKHPVYLVHNVNNHKRINEICNRYHKKFEIKKIIQDEMPIVNLSGKLCIKKEDSFDFLMAPNGCGNFINFRVRDKKVYEDIIANECQYVYATGISNIAEQVCDPYMIGLLDQSQGIGVTYKCTHPENEGENLPRVLFNQSKNCPEVNELEELVDKAEKQCLWDVRKSPVFTNSIYFKIDYLKGLIEKGHQKLGSDSILFSPKKSKCSLWNPTVPMYQDDQHCYIFERELSDLLVTGNSKSVGVMVAREEEFIPIISLHGEKKWADGMEQLEYLNRNSVAEDNRISLISNFDMRNQM